MARWQKGQSGNPSGRPRGSRDRLTESFISQLADDWQQHGHETLERVRQDDPAAYCRLATSVIPKNIEMKQNNSLDEINRMNAEELRQKCRDTQRQQVQYITCLEAVRQELEDTREFLELLEAKERELMDEQTISEAFP